MASSWGACAWRPAVAARPPPGLTAGLSRAGVELRLSTQACALVPWAPSGGDGDSLLTNRVWSLPSLPVRPAPWARPDPPSLTHSQRPRSTRAAAEARIQSELVTVLSNLADLANAVHWLPPGFLWAGRFPPWLVGLLGTISSLLGVFQAARASGRAGKAAS